MDNPDIIIGERRRTILREAQLEAIFSRGVRSLGGIVVKLAPTMAGVPDRLVLLPESRFYLVELKTETGQLSPIQTAWHYRANRLGTPVATLFGEAEVRKWIRERADDTLPKEEEYDSFRFS